MKRNSIYTTGYLVILLAFFALQPSAVVVAQADGVFELGFAGDVLYEDETGTVVSGDYECLLTQSNIADPDDAGDPIHTGKGAQGWSVSMASELVSIADITTTGTAADAVADGGYFEGGFNKTELTTEAGAGSACEGMNGAVSAIVLSFTSGNVLPENTSYVIAKLTVEGTIPAETAAGKLVFVDGCKGAGQPVQNNVTQAGETVVPTLGELPIELRVFVPPPSCCDDELNVGFSAEAVIGSATLFDNIEDASDTCSASGGSIEVAPGDAHVYANIISNMPDAAAPEPPNLHGAQGWSLSIPVDGSVTLADATTAGTAVDTYFNGGFNKTEVVDPANNGGQQGAVSAVVLSFTAGNTLPPVGTESVLDMTVQVAGDPGATVGTVRFESGLIGAGQPVTNAVTVEGDTKSACNFDVASVDLVISSGPVESPFIRGNPNNDAKVNIADPIWIVNELFREGPATVCQDAADANNDGIVDVSDVTFLIEYEFSGGPMPPAPFPDCGTDPEGVDDGLVCEEAQNVCS